jgi:hypothetical protein
MNVRSQLNQRAEGKFNFAGFIVEGENLSTNKKQIKAAYVWKTRGKNFQLDDKFVSQIETSKFHSSFNGLFQLASI